MIEAEITPDLITCEPCQVHRSHYPRSFENMLHHVWPLRYGGPSTKANTVIVCPTGASNIWSCLVLLMVGGGRLAPSDAIRFGSEERKLAQQGYARIVRKAM